MRFDLKSGLLFLVLSAAAHFCAGAAGAQQREEKAQPVPSAQKVDEFGGLRHCDLTARLDNFAIELQNNPGAQGYVVGYEPTEKRGAAENSLKVARHYLVHVRGLDPTRIAVVNAGAKDAAEATTELWLVPAGAEAPVNAPEADKYASADFSGRFDVFTTDERVFREVSEVGTTAEDISRAEFAEKLKRQPDSIGYLVIGGSKDGPPGAWRWVARREEQILRKEHGIGAERLKSIGGEGEGERALVELWVLPKYAPPPTVASSKVENRRAAAFKLNTYDAYGAYEAGDENMERWLFENLAEALREDLKSTAFIVVREPKAFEQESADPAQEPAPTAQESAAAEVEPETDGAAGEEQEGARPVVTMRELAEGWKRKLAADFGIDAGRLVLAEGRRTAWGVGRLNVWVVPEKAARPDPAALDEDDAEEEQADEPQ